MADRWVGIVASGDRVTMVDAEVPASAHPPRSDPSGPALNPVIAEMIGRLIAQDTIDFDAQKRTEPWATTHEAQISGLIASSPTLLPAGSSITALECRTTICRLWIGGVARAVNDSFPPEATKPVKELFESLGYGVAQTVRRMDGSPTEDHLYILRPGALINTEPQR